MGDADLNSLFNNLFDFDNFFDEEAFNEVITETNEQDNNKHEQQKLKMNKETTTNVINEASTSETPEENRTGDKTSAENVGRQFVNVDIEMIESFLEENTNKNTKKKTECDLKIFKEFLQHKNEQRNIEFIPPNTLNEYICQFLLSVTKKDGSQYEPVTLRSFISSIDRHLRSTNSKFSIITSFEFNKAREVLKQKQKSLKKQGLGNQPKTAATLEDAHIQKMIEAKTLGAHNSRSLIHSLWLVCTTNFGMRTGAEVHSLQWGDVQLGIDEETGDEYIVLNTERQTKTRSGINPKDTRLSFFNLLFQNIVYK